MTQKRERSAKRGLEPPRKAAGIELERRILLIRLRSRGLEIKQRRRDAAYAKFDNDSHSVGETFDNSVRCLRLHGVLASY